MTASDLDSGLKSVEYLLADQAFEEKDAVSGDWSKLNVQNGNTSFNIDANKKAFVYVRVSDESGNVQIINSDGVVDIRCRSNHRGDEFYKTESGMMYSLRFS